MVIHTNYTIYLGWLLIWGASMAVNLGTIKAHDPLRWIAVAIQGALGICGIEIIRCAYNILAPQDDIVLPFFLWLALNQYVGGVWLLILLYHWKRGRAWLNDLREHKTPRRQHRSRDDQHTKDNI